MLLLVQRRGFNLHQPTTAYRQLAASLRSGFKSRLNGLLALLTTDRRQLQYYHQHHQQHHYRYNQQGEEEEEEQSWNRRRKRPEGTVV